MPASSYVNREHVGGAVDTTITADITAISLTITIASAVGWPTGGVNGPFHVIVDYDVAGKEKIEVQSRTGTSLTIADTGKRGIDGTSAASHVTGATIRHCATAIDFQEANDHITNTALDHHTQYLNSARHAAITHTSAMLGTDSVGADEIAAGAVGTTELADLGVTTGKLAALAVDSGKLATDAVTNAKVANDAINTAEIVNLAVTQPKLAADAVANANIANDAVNTAEILNSAVTTAKIADANVTAAKISNEAISTYTPTLTGVTLGTGNSFGRYRRMGKLVSFSAGFRLGVGGDVTALIFFSLPPGLDADTTADIGFVIGAWADVAGNRYAGAGIIVGTGVDAGRAGRIVNVGDTLGWGATTPGNWTNGDFLAITGWYPTSA